MTSTETLGRVRDLLAIQSAAVLGVSYEPGWTDVDLTPYLQALQWVVLGGESGADAKPFRLDWATRQIDAGASAGVPVFVKQLGRVPHDDMGILFNARRTPLAASSLFRLQQLWRECPSRQPCCGVTS